MTGKWSDTQPSVMLRLYTWILDGDTWSKEWPGFWVGAFVHSLIIHLSWVYQDSKKRILKSKRIKNVPKRAIKSGLTMPTEVDCSSKLVMWSVFDRRALVFLKYCYYVLRKLQSAEQSSASDKISPSARSPSQAANPNCSWTKSLGIKLLLDMDPYES